MTADMQARAERHMPVGTQSWGAVLRRTVRNPKLWLATIVLVPTILWYIAMVVGPILEAFWLALFHVDIANMGTWWDMVQTSEYTGALHFQHLFDPTFNPQFWPGTLHSVIWTIIQFVLVLPLGLILALSLATVTRLRGFYQIAILVPLASPTVAVALMMGKIFDPYSGPINVFLSAHGFPTSQWIQDPVLALPLAAAIGAWRWLGFYIIILTAGVLNIPRDVLEAARVDGADVWQRFRLVTLPLLGHVLTLVAVMLLVNSMQEYALPYTLGGGSQQFTMGADQTADYGSNLSLVLLNLALYKQTFGGLFTAFGPASAGGVLEFCVVLIGSVVLLKILRPKWSY